MSAALGTATLAQPVRLSLGAFLPSLSIPALRSSAVASSSSFASSSSAAGPLPVQLEQATPAEGLSVWQTLQDLMPSLVWAVPKKQTSKRAKRLNSLNKHLKPKHNITHCPACGLPKLQAHLCTNCLATIRRDLKNAKRIHEHLALQAAKAAAEAEGVPLVAKHQDVRPKSYLETGNPAPVEGVQGQISRRPATSGTTGSAAEAPSSSSS